MDKDQAPDGTQDETTLSEEDLKHHVLENLSEKIVDQLTRTQPDDVTLLDQDYGYTAELVVTACLHRETIEELFEVDASSLWERG